MPRSPGPDPSQQPARSGARRPGDDGANGDAIRAVPAAAPAPEPARAASWSDDELLTRPWRAEAGHVGNWPKGVVIPPGTFADAAWVRELIGRGFVSPVED